MIGSISDLLNPTALLYFVAVTRDRVPMIGVIVGAMACVVWAIGLAVFQPWVDREVAQRWPLYPVAGTHSYWAREVRWFAVLLAVAALVLIAGGRRRAVGLGVVAGVVWFALDIVLDRVGVAGAAAAVVAGVLAFGTFLGLAAVLRPVPQQHAREWRLPAAIVCVVLAVFVAHQQTRDEMVPLSLAVTELVLGVGFMVVAVMLARGANSGRRGYFAAALVILPGIVAAIVWFRYTYGEVDFMPEPLGFVFVPVVVGMLAVTLLARPRVNLAAAIGLAVLSALVMYVVTLFLIIMAMPVADALTAAAANRPVHGADVDAVESVYAAVAGVVCGCLMGILGRTRLPADHEGQGHDTPSPVAASL
jgi:hypothetical protein